MPKKTQTRGKKAPKTYDLRAYIHEATKAPFELTISDDEVLEIPAPTVDRILDAGKLDNSDVEESLKVLVGEDAYDEFRSAIGPAPIGALFPLMKDIQDHFGIGGDQGESDASSGS